MHCCVLHWGNGFKKTILFDTSLNTPTFYMASSSKAYRAFTATYEAFEAAFFRRETVLQVNGLQALRKAAELDPSKFVAVENLNLRQKKREANLSDSAVTEDGKMVKASNVPPDPHKVTKPAAPEETICHKPLTFDPNVQSDDAKDTLLATPNNQAELMRWHYRLGHLSFTKLKQLAHNGKIPKKLAKVIPPKCTGCLFGAMTKLPLCGKENKSSHEVFVATKPGEMVSVDQMASTEVGFFAQLKGTLTKKRYKCATIFVDHFSRLHFVHLQINNFAVQTIAAKRVFKTFAAKHGVRIQNYHCDNGCFYDNAFQQSCHDSHHCLTFCGVNAHFQNGIAERAIQNLSKSTCKQLLHVHAQWPAAVHFALWPYALRNAALLHINLPVLEDGTSWLELFSSICVGANMKHMHTFACPVFALQNTLASGNQLPRWSPRAHLSLNLGPSPIHAKNVYLVLNLTTGCISPQYHCCFDNFFEMTRHGGPDISSTICWQQLAGLMHASQFLSNLIAPTQPNTVLRENSLVSIPNTLDEFLISQVDFGSTEDDGSVTSEASHVNISSVNHQSGSRMPRNL